MLAVTSDTCCQPKGQRGTEVTPGRGRYTPSRGCRRGPRAWGRRRRRRHRQRRRQRRPCCRPRGGRGSASAARGCGGPCGCARAPPWSGWPRPRSSTLFGGGGGGRGGGGQIKKAQRTRRGLAHSQGKKRGLAGTRLLLAPLSQPAPPLSRRRGLPASAPPTVVAHTVGGTHCRE
jgi:hypothetical protein